MRKYEVLEKIGHGSFGIIRKVRRKDNGEILCRKEINYMRMSQKEREQLQAEFAILSSLKHPNIVGYYHREHLRTSQDLHLYMEYCGNGDLGKIIKDLQAKNKYAEEGFVWSIFAQLVTALYRCHYGVDPPEVGSNVMGLGNIAKPQKPAGGVMILHRDLKPENIFLGEGNSVKLGDFGLSKLMQSHDFASTYVGTPFYMSPEICAAERYTLKSDIWSLGCIMYELCTREVPFNAKSHFQLVQKIKEGKVAPIPNIYSPELQSVIKDCLKVNPDRRVDTVTLLNLPVVKLMRKEKEVVELGRLLRTKEEAAKQQIKEIEERTAKLEAERAAMRAEIDSSLRREWEVKAQLEINRLVQVEVENLRNQFDEEVRLRVEEELQKSSNSANTSISEGDSTARDLYNSREYLDPASSVGSTGDDYSTTTDLTDHSMSPEPSKILKKSTRTPFSRAQTMFAGTPMDIEMADPSPICIASLSLSPRRNNGTKAPSSGRNIFAQANINAEHRLQPMLLNLDSDDEDEIPVPSPTRPKSKANPFNKAAGRPQLISQRTAPLQKLNTQSSARNLSAELRSQGGLVSKKEASSPVSKRLSKIPSATNLSDLAGSPTRKPSLTKKNAGMDADLSKQAMKNNMKTGAVMGRTLVELQQARAGGRPMDMMSPTGKGKSFGVRMVEKERGEGATARLRGSGGSIGDMEPTVWDPEKDEMPSPFLIRTSRGVAGRSR
ncbi:putative NIMA kinase protein [Rutstroemia sp. NJR-2017a BVV2]|nr:putative NIMA kinase protein [Rutstroemia sp. NJR-2017a BVV2]